MTPYTEEELWKILISAAKGLDYLRSKSIAHGDIKPAAIHVTKTRDFKICDISMLGTGKNAYENTRAGKERPPLSPILMDGLNKKLAKPLHDPFKSDIFSLGMTMLNFATLESFEKLYNWRPSQCSVVEAEVLK